MPSIDELHETVQNHGTAIAVLAERADQADEWRNGADRRMRRYDDEIAELKALAATVATRDDLNTGLAALNEKLDRQMDRAFGSIPGWAAALAGIVVALVSVAGFGVQWIHR